MNNTKLNKGMVLLGIGLMFVGLVFFAWYEFFGGRERFHYTNVVVLTQAVKEGETITAEKLAYYQYDKELVLEDTITNPDDVIGKAATHYIAPYQKLHGNYFDDVNLVLKQGEYITPIPMDWVLTVPSTLRRGDDIIIYAVTEVEENGVQVTSEDDVNAVETDEADSGPILAIAESSELIELFNTTVAYVKDAGNQEVYTTSDVDRLNGSSSIATIELISTTDEFKEIEKVVRAGGKLIIMYGQGE